MAIFNSYVKLPEGIRMLWTVLDWRWHAYLCQAGQIDTGKGVAHASTGCISKYTAGLPVCLTLRINRYLGSLSLVW
jgi:hypothetical protein